MRKILSLIVLITGVCLSSFSQIRNPLHIEPFKSFSFNKNMERFSLGDTNIKGQLNNTFNGKNFLFPQSSGKNQSFIQNLNASLDRSKSFDNMPCLKPQGYFPMPVYKPDSTIRFSLLIKKYNKEEMGNSNY